MNIVFVLKNLTPVAVPVTVVDSTENNIFAVAPVGGVNIIYCMAE